MSQNVNSVVITGNLTRDPELRHTESGTAICELRVAVNSRRKDSQTGEWVDKPNFFDVTVWGAHGANCAEYLAKGRPVAIDGRLDWREWETTDGGKRQAVQIIANTVQFLGTKKDGSAESGSTPSSEATASSNGQEEIAAATDPEAGAAGGSTPENEDIPF